MSDHPAGDPFGGIPFFGDIARLLGQQGAGGWDAARQIAVSLATEGVAEPNVDPLERIRLVELARVAELHVADVTGLPLTRSGPLHVLPVTRAEWARRTLDDYRPLFQGLADGLGASAAPEATGEPSNPTTALFDQLMRALSPMMLGMMAGSMVGHLARRALGHYDLPIPRPSGDELLLAVPNLDELASEWSLGADDLRLWLCIREITTHAVISVPHVGDHLRDLLDRHARGFRSDPTALEERFAGLGAVSTPDDLQQAFGDLFGDPEVLLGAIRSPAQLALLPDLHALVAAITGFVDHTVDLIGTKLLTNHDQLTEALRRRRVEAGPSDRFVERMLGLELTQAQYDRGRSFVDGIVERAGQTGLARLWASSRELPTPNEVDAPGLWLARIDLPG